MKSLTAVLLMVFAVPVFAETFKCEINLKSGSGIDLKEEISLKDFIVPVDDAHRFFENSIDSSYPNGGVAIRIHDTDMKTLDVFFINDVNLILTNDLPLFTEKNTLAALNVVSELKSKTIKASSWAGGMTSYVSCKKMEIKVD